MSTIANDPRPHVVYRCFDAEGTLLYIGSTHDIEGRMYHLTALCNIGKSPNGYLRRHLDRYTVESYPDRVSALAAERAAIKAENPLLNVQSASSPAPLAGAGAQPGADRPPAPGWRVDFCGASCGCWGHVLAYGGVPVAQLAVTS